MARPLRLEFSDAVYHLTEEQLGVRSCNTTSPLIKSVLMARPLRLEFSGAIYHLTARGNARQKIFFSDADRQLFMDTLAGVVFRYGWICHAYCLMANHYHLLVETPKPNLSLGMRQLNGIYTQAFNRRHRRVGHCFRADSRRFWWRRNRTCWSFAATLCSTRCGSKGMYRPAPGNGAVTGLRRDWFRPRSSWRLTGC